MTEQDIRYINNHLASGKITQAVKDAIRKLLAENNNNIEQIRYLEKANKQLMNRCKVFGNPILCMHCGFKDKCLEK